LLPVSELGLTVGEPTGHNELFLVETALAPLPAMLELLGRLARTTAGDQLDWRALPLADVEAAALMIRRAWVGETIRTNAFCPREGCRERIDVSFRIEDYITHHRPKRARGVTAPSKDGWFNLAGTTARFRIPTVADVVAASSSEEPEHLLSERCVDAPEISRLLARRLDRALAALAPRLDDLLGGICPECGHEVTMRFDPLEYILSELRDEFAAIHAEIHALASAYGWTEETILALPRSRRRRYAAIVADERAAA
jgi:hypothetical protein